MPFLTLRSSSRASVPHSRLLKSKLFRGAVIVAAVVPGLSMAASGDIDTAEALGYITAGVAAAGIVTGAMFGLVALIGAGKKAMRAGT